MLKLYGFRTSSYYSMVKLTLMEKEIPFEEVHVPIVSGVLEPDPGYLEKNPIGKVPTLETEHGCLSETSVIIDYLDELAGRSFYPRDSFSKAKTRELIKHIELYLELPARRLFGEFFSNPVSDAEKRAVQPLLESGIRALTALAKFEPYLMGKTITYADFFGLFALNSVTRVTQGVYDWDTYNTVPGLRRMMETMRAQPKVKRLFAERE